ncbi:hypothetical protein ACSBR2_004414 [Camellia fascicularis]
MPGGYNGNDGPNQGMAILTRKAAFQAFMVTDTIAMSCSILAVITHFDAAITNNRDTLQKQVNKAAYLISSAAGAMVLAFVTGTYVVLAHSSGFAISAVVRPPSFAAVGRRSSSVVVRSPFAIRERDRKV